MLIHLFINHLHIDGNPRNHAVTTASGGDLGKPFPAIQGVLPVDSSAALAESHIQFSPPAIYVRIQILPRVTGFYRIKD